MEDGHLLRQLQKYGEQFIEQFGSHLTSTTWKRHARDATDKQECTDAFSESGSGSNEEWEGISDTVDLKPDTVHVVDHSKVVSSATFQEIETFGKGKRAFLTSSISRLSNESKSTSAQVRKGSKREIEDPSNLENDAILQRMIHTQLLSGSLNSDLNMTPAQRRMALAGRVEEVAGSSKIGKGESLVRKLEHDRSPKHIRDGIKSKKAKVLAAKQAESKELGNYHPILRKAFNGDENAMRPKKKRVRGLGLGVGKFRGGTLHLGREEIQGVSSIKHRTKWRK